MQYNMHEAISLRGLTFNQAGLYDVQYMHPSLRDKVINFRTSIDIAREENQWGNIPLHAEILMFTHGTKADWPKTSRKNWKTLYQNHRCYLRQAPAPSL